MREESERERERERERESPRLTKGMNFSSM
jgi:hypothetical protein